jgi:hypothetical protein
MKKIKKLLGENERLSEYIKYWVIVIFFVFLCGGVQHATGLTYPFINENSFFKIIYYNGGVTLFITLAVVFGYRMARLSIKFFNK